MLGFVESVLTVVWKLIQQLPTKCNYMQQGVQTDGKFNMKQCWELRRPPSSEKNREGGRLYTG